MIMSWNYRLVHRYDATLDEHVFAIHEAYYDEDAEEPHSITTDPSWPQGETWEEFCKDFAFYQAASLYPKSSVLEYSDFEKVQQPAPHTGEGVEYFNEEHLERVRAARDERASIEARQTVKPINGLEQRAIDE
jgi:hypothetical protein